MEMEKVAQIVAVIAALLGIVNMLWLWHSHSRMPTENALNKLKGDVDRHDDCILALQLEMKHLPTKDEVSRLQMSLIELLGKLGLVEAEVSATARTLRRMEDHLLKERT